MRAPRLALCLLLLPGLTAVSHAQPPDATRQYTYAWQFIEDSAMQPRGGTSQGPEVELVTGPTDSWLAIREAGISDQERDRRAILAMAGPYRTSFDFIETVGFTPGYQPTAPYQSWGTEHVYVVADKPDFVSLQHILVMRIVKEDGTHSDPIVVKHWRQDWRYEHRELNVYAGHSTWAQQTLPRNAVKGTWTQSVYQVDDSPRYQAKGTWRHFANYSSWQSDETWRPLPRREFSVRDDYHVLIGTNRHTIYPTGWVQEEDNLKVVLDPAGNVAKEESVLAREAGLARYERITAFDWSAGDEYWQRTGPFWSVVRDAWAETLNSNDRVTLRGEVDGKSMFMAMFSLAEETTADTGFDPTTAKALVGAEMRAYTSN